MWPIIVDVRRSISPWQALMQFLYMETHAFLTNTSAYKNITVCTSYECRQSYTWGSNQSHLFPKYKGLTRSSWEGEEGMVVSSRTWCRLGWVKHLKREYQGQDKWGQTPPTNPPGDKYPEQEQAKELVWREHPIPFSLGHHTEEENLKPCTQLEITSCSFCFCNSASSCKVM